MDFKLLGLYLIVAFVKCSNSDEDQRNTHTSTSGTCRNELNDYAYCLKNALDKTRLNRTAIDIGIKKCFEDNQCKANPFTTTSDDRMTESEKAIANNRLAQTPFKNVDWLTFEQCKVTVKSKARDQIRTCVLNQMPSFAPDIDEDINEDGEEDGIIERNQTLGSYALSKLADSTSICGENVDRQKVKECIREFFRANRPAKDKNQMKKLFDDYCSSRDQCKIRLSPSCVDQLNHTHRLLCQCTIDEIAASKGDDLRNEFLDCAKVENNQRGSIVATAEANPHRIYASSAFCHAHFDPCSWLWRQLADESGSPETIQSIIEQLTNNADTGRLTQSAQAMMRQVSQDMTFYHNESDGQVGQMLSDAFDQSEIDRLRLALAGFVDPYNSSIDYLALLSNEELINNLIARLTANNSEAQRLSMAASKFFGFAQNLGNGSSEDVETLMAKLTDPQLFSELQIALYEFIYPYGNTTHLNITEGDQLGSILNNLKAVGAPEETKLLSFAGQFQNPYGLSAMPMKMVVMPDSVTSSVSDTT